MTYPLAAAGTGRSGFGYGVVAVREDPLPALRALRFSGWVAPPEDGWHVIVAASVERPVASRRRGVVGVGAALGPALAVRVIDDRQLLLEMPGVGRYVSDTEYDGSEDSWAVPAGVEHAAAIAAACGRPSAGSELTEVLAEELDTERVGESERLVEVLRLLGLPLWTVAVSSLPRDIPTGPPAAALTRLRSGATGLPGRLRSLAARPARRRWPDWPPPTA